MEPSPIQIATTLPGLYGLTRPSSVLAGLVTWYWKPISIHSHGFMVLGTPSYLLLCFCFSGFKPIHATRRETGQERPCSGLSSPHRPPSSFYSSPP
ncbi:hypothetical protein BDQ94DRAFT_154064, partial [Aspergillus welwitschiae]